MIAGAVAGRRELIDEVRAVEIDTGGIAAPFTAFLVLRGMETLHVRMERHCANALAIARYLESQPEVRAVRYPGLASHPQAAVAQRELRAGGGMLALDLGERVGRGCLPRCAHDPDRVPHRWGASRPSPSTRRPVRIASSTTPSSRQRASRRAWCASRSGSRTQRI